jgi:hypothetical protein
MTAERATKQKAAEQEKASRESWEKATRQNSAHLAKTTEQLKAEQELADVKRQLAELKAAQQQGR